jgi:D-alanyl-D-alanine carboxypeptidase
VQNHLIRHITQQREFTIQGRDRRHRTHRLANTNRLLYADYHFACAKTGYILEAGWCIAARATSPQGNDVTTVVLGAPSDGFRFGSLRNAINWAFALPTHRRANSRSEG